MKLEWIILCAIALDLLLGDPRRFPHPVRIIGASARKLELFFRKRIQSPFWAGLWTAATVYAASFFLPFVVLKASYKGSAWAGNFISVYLIYTTIAMRDLIQHSQAVYHALNAANLEEARKNVGMMVGRDTHELTQKEVIRACVESVAESMVDGVTAPLFFAIMGGPAWAVLYRAINTLDSLFGHQDDRYKSFGKVSAKIDDLVNYLPARITSLAVAFSSLFLFLHPVNSFFVLLRDGDKHPSPNSGLPEAAVAGALGIQLGGENFYDGAKSKKPYLGEKKQELHSKHILQANRLMLLASLLTCGFYLLVSRCVCNACLGFK